MRRKRFTEERIIAVLREHEAADRARTGPRGDAAQLEAEEAVRKA